MMSTATNVDAHAVNTIAWLSDPETTIVVPVYQRQYRWDIGGCEQLLSDVRSVADEHDRHTHFLGSILSSRSGSTDETELVLIDGQQRITTLMLLIAALHHIARSTDPELAVALERALVRAADPSRTKLRPHAAWADVFESVVLDRPATAEVPRTSRFDDNYAFFRSQIRPDEISRIWRGLQRLEHVSITLGADANAQQIFESLNSTGEPLRDHELIHNYVLMGLTHPEQREIEESAWLPIEQNTGDAIPDFWRHYLVMRTGREISGGGGREVYDAFRSEFPRLVIDTLREHAAEWKAFSEIYRVLREPAHADDALVAQHLAYANTFGRGMYPLTMRAYADRSAGRIDRGALVQTLEDIQSLQLRRIVVGLGTDRLVARLCRARADGAEALTSAIARITPSDERVRVGLKYSPLPHAAYVLGRIGDVRSLADVEVEHIFPVAPGDAWTGDGVRTWAEYDEDEQNSHRALTDTLGNLALLEEPLAERAADKSYPVKRALYARSAIAPTSALGEVEAWSTAAIGRRTVTLTERFLQIWRRPASGAIDDDGLTPILDAQRRRGWPRGWQREFEYVEYRGEHWEVYDVRYLFARIFARLWADSRAHVVSFSERNGGPVFAARAWNGLWDSLDEQHSLYLGWDSRYMLTALQGVLDDAGLAPEVFVKYSHIGAAMDES